MPLEKTADIKIVDHMRKEAPPGTYVSSLSICIYMITKMTEAIRIPSLNSLLATAL